MSEDNIFGTIKWDEGTDNPWGLEPGTHEVTISEAEISRSEKGNLGLWLTFSDDEGLSIRKWATLPEPEQDFATRKRNTSYLRVLMHSLEIPEDQWTKLTPDLFVGLDCVIFVKQQANNPEYNQVSKIVRAKGHTAISEGVVSYVPDNVPDDGGFKF